MLLLVTLLWLHVSLLLLRTHTLTHVLCILYAAAYSKQFMGVTYLNTDGQLNPLELQRTGAPYKYGIHDLNELVKTCLPASLLQYKHPNARL